MNIEIGKKYRHLGTGRIVTVVNRVRNVLTIVGIYDDHRHCHAFESELGLVEPAEIEKKPETVIQPSGHQTILGSIVESWVNIVIGFSINFTANMLILPLFGFHDLTLGKNFIIGLFYTVISLVRSFVIRRYFNSMKWGNK